MGKIKLIAVVGPTASGKTALAVHLAKRLNGEIVSADSMQIYKGMPIASAVPTVDERCKIPHHLIEILEPTERFTVADYVSMAHKVIKDIDNNGKIPIVVGGTGLYIDSLLKNITFASQDANSKVRKELVDEAEELGIKALYDRLSEIDPQAAKRLHINDKKRIIRALEVHALTGKTFTEQNEASRQAESLYDPLIIGLRFADRQKLYDRINSRVDVMLENGLVDEARLSFKNCSEYPTASAAIGHKELFEYFKGIITLDEALQNLKQATRRYAKRQMTWFNKNSDIHWIEADVVDNVFDSAYQIIENFLI